MVAIPTPRENTHFVGHAEAEAQWIEAFSSKRMHHAWLVTGPKGIGKATFAYRLARFLLSGAEIEPGEADMFGGAPKKPTVALSPSHPIVSRVASGAHGDLLVLDTMPTEDEENKSEIKVEDVRKVSQFLSMTPAEAGWRVVIIDSADEMNHNAANALLKLLEEPPAQSIIILISHTSGKLLPTIRSRCVHLRMNPLPEKEIADILKQYHPEGGSEINFASAVSSGSPGLALTLADAGALELYGKIIGTLSTLPNLDRTAVLSLADSISGRDESQWQLAEYLLRYFVSTLIARISLGEQGREWVPGEEALRSRLAKHSRLDSWMELWEKMGRMLVDADRINMGKKHTAVALLESFRAAAA